MVTSLLAKAVTTHDTLRLLACSWQTTALSTPPAPLPELLFIDPSLPDYTAIIARQSANTIIHHLDPDQDSLQQIRTILEKSQPVAAVHVHSHEGRYTFY
ncbi:MAG: DUF4347 domain-containing protein [Magnetococcales bacterium]|nr:DUF4347 domain-containing protein [Magnetococcales bacterium]